MTNQELNRDIKRLFVKYTNSRVSEDTSKWSVQDWNNYEAKQNELKKEFNRLYHADRNFDALNKNSLLMMLAMNNNLRVVAFHVFGQIEIKL